MTTSKQADLEHRKTSMQRLEEFTVKLVETMAGGLITCLVEIGCRVGLFELPPRVRRPRRSLLNAAVCRSGTSVSGWPRWQPLTSSSMTQITDAFGCRLSTRPS